MGMIRLKNVSKFYYSKGIIASGITRINLDLDVGECAGSEIGLAGTTTYAVQILGSLAVVGLNISLGSEEINLGKTHPTIVVGVGHGTVAAPVLGVEACTPLPHEEILDAVAKGNIAQTFFDDSMAQSSHAAEYVLDYLRGIEVPYETWVGYVNVTVDNAQEILDVLSATEESDEEEYEEP